MTTDHSDARQPLVVLATELVLTQEQLPPGQLTGHRKGWSTILSLLEPALSGSLDEHP